jgi:hypothetical protein
LRCPLYSQTADLQLLLAPAAGTSRYATFSDADEVAVQWPSSPTAEAEAQLPALSLQSFAMKLFGRKENDAPRVVHANDAAKAAAFPDNAVTNRKYFSWVAFVPMVLMDQFR